MMRDWLKLAGQEGAEVGKAEQLWRVRKTEKVDFKGQKKLIAGESALKGWEGVELVTAVEQCVSGAKALRFIGR